MPRLSKEVVEQRKAKVKEFFKNSKEFKTEQDAIKAGQEYMKKETGMGMSAELVRAAWGDNATVTPKCDKCAKHYGDSGVCDEGKPVASPHRESPVENTLEGWTEVILPTETKYNSASDEISALKARIRALEDECLTYRATVGTLMKNAGKIYQPGQVNFINVVGDIPQERVDAVMEVVKEAK